MDISRASRALPAGDGIGVRFDVLGPLRVTVDGQPVRIGSAKQRVLLAVLLLRANRCVPVPVLVEALWCAAPPASARRVVHTLVWRLRRLLPDGVARISHLPAGYRLRVSPGESDAAELAAALARGRGRRSQGDADAVRTLRAAIELWRGEPLDDVPLPAGFEVEAAELAERHAAAIDEYADAALDGDAADEVVDVLTPVVAAHPERERAAGLLMRALARCGRRGEALAVFDTTRRVLARDYGLSPGPALQQVQRQVLTEDAGAATGPPPLAGLPPDLPTFTGRRGDIDTARRLLEQPPGALVITGLPGVGKSTLALRLGHLLSPAHEDGQIYLDLGAQGHPLRPEQALARLLRRLGVPDDQLPDDLAEQTALGRRRLAGRAVVIVLDNAHDEAQVRPLLCADERGTILVTARRTLAGLDGARIMVLDPLTPADGADLLAALVGRPRVNADPAATGELVGLCGGLPLALRIAAARLASRPSWTVADLAHRLRDQDRRLAELSAGDRTVQAALDVSHDALPASDQELFRRLAALPAGDFAADTARALDPSGDDLVAGLDRLTDASLLQATSGTRYRLHDLVRLYAGARDVDPGAAGRLYDWYLHAAMAATDLIAPHRTRLPLPLPPRPAAPLPAFVDRAAAVAWLNRERRHLVAAIGNAVTLARDEDGWRLAYALFPYFNLYRHSLDWLSAIEFGLVAAGRTGGALARGAMYASRGLAHSNLGRYDQAAEDLAEAMRAAEAGDWPQGRSMALNNLANVHYAAGRMGQARACYQRAAAIDRELGDDAAAAIVLGNLGNVHTHLDELDDALHAHLTALDIHRKTGNQASQVRMLATCAAVYRLRGRSDQALSYAVEALALARDTGFWTGTSLVVAAEVHRDAGSTAQALDCATEALLIARSTADRQVEVDALNVLATVETGLNRPDDAMTHHQDACHLAETVGLIHGRIEALIGMAAVYQGLGRATDAVHAGRRALALARDSEHRLYQRLATQFT